MTVTVSGDLGNNWVGISIYNISAASLFCQLTAHIILSQFPIPNSQTVGQILNVNFIQILVENQLNNGMVSKHKKEEMQHQCICFAAIFPFLNNSGHYGLVGYINKGLRLGLIPSWACSRDTRGLHQPKKLGLYQAKIVGYQLKQAKSLIWKQAISESKLEKFQKLRSLLICNRVYIILKKCPYFFHFMTSTFCN